MVQEDKHLKTQTQQQKQQHQQISMSNTFAKDLLQRLMSGNHLNHKINGVEEREEEDIELSLGLSLNGRFGVDPRAKKLTRSSSIPDFVYPTGENGSAYMIPVVSSTNLVRTCSLPTETDKEWRKRKEMQMLRRMEAKRKRSEKQRILKAVKDRNKGFVEESCEEEKRENGTINTNCNYHQEQFLKNFNVLFGAGAEGALPSSQGSIGSQGSGSSGSESESQQVQGMNNCIEARSRVSVQSLSERARKLTVTPKSTINGKPSSPADVAMVISRSNEPTVINGAKDTVRNILEDMPCVSTKGEGPNGKRIEGFLYRYRKGEEVRIVCVCHGSFLSPAEFVKHAGGGDVAHPLKHIVVSPYPLL
ncbi:ninja-family protein AFP3 [Jatropha curcas]|uniref:ninja-family protein AFP3 n=1 Tax=Jatropha curcas TaxID=180498 RepID=UPI0005FAB5FF|nr:ninja-family protein AFP3 [Jatropha curcas]